MRSRNLRTLGPVSVCLFATVAGFAQAIPAPAAGGAWTVLSAVPADVDAEAPWVRQPSGAVANVDTDTLRSTLDRAPLEHTPGAVNAPAQLLLPTPDGGLEAFEIVESPIMAPELAARYPEIHTYVGRGVDDRYAHIRLDWTPQGFHAQVLTPKGSWYIDPYSADDTRFYSIYRERDAAPSSRLEGCELIRIPGNDWPMVDTHENAGGMRSGATLRTYRLACAATGEYTAFQGGTKALAQAAIVTAINRVTGIYETEVGVRMELIANNDDVVYTNGSTDPYSNNDGGAMLSQNQSTCDSVIGSGNYDFGHVFSTGGGGVAYLGVICNGGFKAGGVTGLPSPVGDAFYVDYVAHEMGHQFGANHTFNGINGSCAGGNRSGPDAYEPGSASTIMGYAGICGDDDLQAHSDAYFHGHSYDEIRSYIQSQSCDVQSSTGNNGPTMDAGPDYAIPKQTPFRLEASSTDPQGDPVTYCWEEFDLGPGQALSAADNGSSPLFRSFSPRAGTFRNFPKLTAIRTNNYSDDEKIPQLARTSTFRVTGRDNLGGVNFDEMTLTITNNGPFRVTTPNTAVTWGGTQTVTWDVASTNSAPINTSAVDILLSTNSGQSFDTTLLSGTPNDGSATVVLPNISTSTARIKVQPVGNVYFDMSDVDFTIQAPPISVAVTSAVPSQMAPGTAYTVQAMVSDGTQNVVAGSEAVFYRNNGGAYQSLSMSSIGGDMFEATLPAAVCGNPMEFYVQAQGDGGATRTDPANAPTTAYSIDIGTTAVVFSDNFETDMGWTTATSGNPSSGDWQRGVPVNDPGWDYDPASDSDGSGQCYLTENAAGNTDVDGGTVQLLSPVIDMSSGDFTISYDYYLTLTDESGTDRLLVEIQDLTGGAGWITIATHTTDGALSWRSNTIDQAALDSAGVTLSDQMQLRFSANDDNPQSIVEAGLDAVVITGIDCSGGCTDSDGDGVCDPDDICPGGNDNMDTDGDGVPDFCDICPNDNPDDSDGDGVCDSMDICPGGNDNMDTDGDGVPDFCDVCPNDNPDDSDGDGVCDSMDICPGGNDNMDTDGDGVPDFCDVCPNDNPDDSDGDGVCDSMDICPGGNDNADTDGDGVPDFCDVCPNDNPDDSDGDGVCDSMDICPGGNDNADADGDGVPDFCDVCPIDNPDDSDGDGVCDSADICPGFDDHIDTDGDGIPDGCDCAGDADGDGDSDIGDLGLVLSNFGSNVTPGASGDLDFSGTVDITDLGQLLADFGCTP